MHRSAMADLSKVLMANQEATGYSGDASEDLVLNLLQFRHPYI